MSQQKDQWIRASALLLELTQRGNLKWTFKSPSKVFASDLEGKVDLVLVTTFASRDLRLYQETSTELAPDMPAFLGPSWLLRLSGSETPLKERLVTRTFLELTDGDGRGLWAVPSNDVLADLVREAKYIASGAADFLTELLGAAEDKSEAEPRDPTSASPT